MAAKAERVGTIDIARGIAMFMVIFSHTIYSGRLETVLYQVHMPLFFFLSGMVQRVPASAQELRSAVHKRAYTCLLPYCIWGVFFMPVTPGGLLELVYGSWQMICQAGTLSSLWFLPVLFLASVWCDALLFALRALPRPRLFLPGAAALLFAAGFVLPHPLPFGYPFGLDISFVAAGFMLLGYAVLPLLRHLQNPLWGGSEAWPVWRGFLPLIASSKTG